MEEVFNLKGKQKWGHQILLDKLSSTRTLLIIDTMAPRSHGPSRWRSPKGDSSKFEKKRLCYLGLSLGLQVLVVDDGFPDRLDLWPDDIV